MAASLTEPLLDFSEAEIEAIMAAAHPLARSDRDTFLRTVASEIMALPHRGPGAVHRVIVEVQRRFTSQFQTAKLPGRYGRSGTETARFRRLASRGDDTA